MAEGGTLVGLEARPASMNLEVKPYVNTSLTTGVTRTPALRIDFDPEAGFDVDANAVTVIAANGEEAIPLASKAEIAAAIVDRLERWLAQQPVVPSPA